MTERRFSMWEIANLRGPQYLRDYVMGLRLKEAGAPIKIEATFTTTELIATAPMTREYDMAKDEYVFRWGAP